MSDIELYNADRQDILNHTGDYTGRLARENYLTTMVGFNWSSFGIYETPSQVCKCILYRNIQDNVTGTQYTASDIVIGIRGSYTNANNVAITAKYVYGTTTYGTEHTTTYAFASLISATISGDPVTFIVLSDAANYTGISLSGENVNTYRANYNKPFISDADVVDTSGTNYRTLIHDFLYGSGGDMEVTFDIYSTPQGVFDFWWSDLTNIPSGMYQTGYQVRLRTAALDAEPYGTCRVFNAKNYPSVSYQDFIEYFAESYPAAYDEAVRNGFTYMRIEVFHNEGSTAVVDLLGVIKIAYDGGMEDTNSTDPNFHIRLHPHSSHSANDAYDDDDTIQDEQAPGHGMSVDNLLTISYAMTNPSVLSDFGSWLWDNNLQGNIYENQVAPIENVVSCKRIPWNVMDANHPTQIKCGNVFTGVGLNPGTGLVNGDVTIAYTGHKQTVGTIKIPVFAGKSTAQTYGDFTDMESKISIYLPYCGIHMIPTSTAYRQVKDGNGCAHIEGRYLTVEYIYDMIYGSCIANVYVSKTETSKKNLFLSVNGECGIDIPVTSSNRATNELALKRAGLNAVAGTIIGAGSGAALGGAIGGLIGGVGGAVKGMMQRDIEEATQETHFTTAGGFNSQVASYMSKTVTLYIEHEKYTEPSQYGHQNGYPCNLCLNLSSLHGYTELSGEAEISGIPCFIEEQEGIKNALMQGFYID